MTRTPAFLYLAAFSAYSLVACALMWPLVKQIGGAVPAGPQSDYYHFIWNYWWIGFALEHGLSPWYTDFVLYPGMHNLSLHTLTPFWFPVYAVLEPLFGRVAAANLFVIASLPLTGVAAFAWLRRLLGGQAGAGWAAFAGGAAAAFQPYLLWSAGKMHLNVIALWWLPLTLLLWHELARAQTRLRSMALAVALGLTLWGGWLTDLQQALFLPLAAGPYVLWTAWASRNDLRRCARLAGWGGLALAIMTLLMLIWPLRQVLELDTSNPYSFPPAGLTTIRAYALELDALIGLAPYVEGRTLGRLLPWIVWTAAGLGIYTAWKRRREPQEVVSARSPLIPPAWFWLLAAMPSLLLMLGPDIMVSGERIILPYSWLHRFLNGQYRTPERFVLPAALNLVYFAAAALTPRLSGWLTRQGHWRRGLAPVGAAVACALVAADAGTLNAFPVRPVRDYPIYAQIGQEDGSYVILDVPVGTHYGWTGMGAGQHSQFYAPLHEKRMVNGFLARMPYSDYAFFADSPLFTWLAGARALEGERDAQRVAEEFDRYLADWPVGYVFAHRAWMSEAQQTEWIGWLNTRAGLCAPAMDADTLLIWWRSAALGCQTPPPTTRIALGTGHDWLFIGPGWHAQESIGGVSARWAEQEAVLRVDLEDGITYTMRLTAVAFHRERQVTIGATTLVITPDWRTYELTITAADLDNGLLRLRHDSVDSPAALGMSSDARMLAAAYTTIVLAPARSP